MRKLEFAEELSDYVALRHALDYEYGRDVSHALGMDARAQRQMNDALERARASLEHRERGTAWRTQLRQGGHDVLRRRPMTLWPLANHDAPAPNWLLSEEVATIATEHLRAQAAHAKTADHLSPTELGILWLAVQAQLYGLLTHVSLIPSAHVSHAALQKEVDRAIAQPEHFKADALEQVLAFHYSAAVHSKHLRTLGWRDMLAPLLVHASPAVRRAAESTAAVMDDLYHAQPAEARLERRTWILEDTLPLRERAALVHRALDALGVYDVLDAALDTLDMDPPLEHWLGGPGAALAPRDLVDQDEVQAAMMWDSEDDAEETEPYNFVSGPLPDYELGFSSEEGSESETSSREAKLDSSSEAASGGGPSPQASESSPSEATSSDGSFAAETDASSSDSESDTSSVPAPVSGASPLSMPTAVSIKSSAPAKHDTPAVSARDNSRQYMDEIPARSAPDRPLSRSQTRTSSLHGSARADPSPTPTFPAHATHSIPDHANRPRAALSSPESPHPPQSKRPRSGPSPRRRPRVLPRRPARRGF